MMAAARIALLQDLLAEADFERIAAVVRRLGPLPSSGDLDLNRLISAMGRDKKTIHGSLHFVLPTRIGGVKVVSNVPEPVVRQAISETLL
jgi:3-dehydroquinate synthase